MAEGPNVDIVANCHELPFEPETYDCIVSTSCFEHDKFFWLTFLEMVRVLKPGGFIYINAPSSGYYHGYPGDAYRFYIDSWKYLAEWAVKNGHNCQLLESFIDGEEPWKDSVGIFTKNV